MVQFPCFSRAFSTAKQGDKEKGCEIRVYEVRFLPETNNPSGSLHTRARIERWIYWIFPKSLYFDFYSLDRDDNQMSRGVT